MQGFFCSNVIEDKTLNQPTIIKTFANNNILSDIWFTIPVEELAKYILNYQNELICANVQLPFLYKIEIIDQSIRIIQELIVGQNIRDKISLKTQNIDENLKYFERLLEFQLQVYDYNKDLRMDLNPDNFILSENKIYYVDITPPLFCHLIKAEGHDIIITKYLNLCFGICAQIAGLINNCLKVLIKNQAFIESEHACELIINAVDRYIYLAINKWSNTPLKHNVKNYFQKLNNIDYYDIDSIDFSLKKLWLIRSLCKGKLSFSKFKILYKDAGFLSQVKAFSNGFHAK